ncbi:unnamed protein product [Rotaria sp. Silwood1]|nr:unnamed protein product [Rotaria sp. Silwood1]
MLPKSNDDNHVNETLNQDVNDYFKKMFSDAYDANLDRMPYLPNDLESVKKIFDCCTPVTLTQCWTYPADLSNKGKYKKVITFMFGQKKRLFTFPYAEQSDSDSDLYAVLRKFGHALIPRKSLTLLQQWDLWGPLILVTTLAILLQSNSTKTSSGIHFAEVFTLMLIGSIIVTINSQLLGGKISFFQSVCVLGYCLLPLLISAFISYFLFYLPFKAILHIIRFLIVMSAFIWTMYASIRFLGQTQQSNRRMLVLYPIFLFYFLVSWLIILRTHSK